MKRLLLFLLLPLACLAQPSSNIFPNIQALTNVDAHTISLDQTPVLALGGGNINGSGTWVVSTINPATVNAGSETLTNLPNWPSQTQNKFWASPNGSSGAPSIRAIVNADLPAIDLSGSEATGTLAAARLGTFTGDITTAGGSYSTSLKSTGTAGTYAVATFDAQGRETSGIPLNYSYTQAGGTNQVLDFNMGKIQDWALTNNVCLIYCTNGPGTSTIRFRANGANRTVLVDTNAMPLNVQGGAANGGYWAFVVTNGTMFSMASFYQSSTSSSANITNVAAVWANF